MRPEGELSVFDLCGRVLRLSFTAVTALVATIAPLPAQQQIGQQPTTRTEEILTLRREKAARLWPERQSPVVTEVNKLVDRGLLEGGGRGANGWQLVMGGMRSGHGMTVGIGYRRTDLFRDRLGFRGTARGTLQEATMFDLELDFQQLRTDHSFLTLYAKYENSPQMDFYGFGADSRKEDRTSYRLEDFATTLQGGTKLWDRLVLAGMGGYWRVHTGSGKRSGVPSTDEVFDDTIAPGLRRDTDYFGFGGVVAFDYRDNPQGPRAGGYYKTRFLTLNDRRLDEYGHNQALFEAQQFIPYFNKTRTIALKAQTVLSFPRSDQRVPFYTSPVLGGNDDLRGFERYRFRDEQSILLSAEHRWHGFSGMDAAIFVDAGKVVQRKADIDFSGLRVSGGFGVRFRVRDRVFMRVEFAAGNESVRFMWTFSDIFVSDNLRKW